MIPKIIHYCWFGHNPKPKLAHKCMKSWKKHCKGYRIIEWNEDNFDIAACPLYVRQAYEQKKWAFVTDYVRLKVVYDHGGIYLDTDVELQKELDGFLSCYAYFGFEDGEYVATGLGFGAEKGAPILAELMADYDGIPFVREDGSFDIRPCPRRNTEVFLRHGLKQDNSRQLLEGNIVILPTDYLCPLGYYNHCKAYTENTVSIHWFSASWQSKEEQQKHEQDVRRFERMRRKDYIIHMPNRVLKKLLGDERYGYLKSVLKK